MARIKGLNYRRAFATALTLSLDRDLNRLPFWRAVDTPELFEGHL